MRVVGLILVLLILPLGMGKSSLFIDPPSTIPILGFTIGALLLAGAGIRRMFTAVFSPRATPDELKAAIHGWAQARTYAVVAGFIGLIVGGGVMLVNMDDSTAIRPGVVLAFLPLLYGLLLGYGIFLPLQSRLEDRVSELDG
jgi:ABC-type nitrate/sulfonate/bicarbonate transport system permease component